MNPGFEDQRDHRAENQRQKNQKFQRSAKNSKIEEKWEFKPGRPEMRMIDP